MSIAAIETVYKGYRFRSRLEARWAVFFDAMGIKWSYEPEGFKTDDDGMHPGIWYLPDFYLPEINVWVEVKGLFSTSNAKELAMFLDWGSPLPGFANSFDEYSKYQGGLVVLGDIPEPINNAVLHKIVRHKKGLVYSWFEFQFHDCLTLVDPHPSKELIPKFSSTDPYEYLVDLFDPKPIIINYDIQFSFPRTLTKPLVALALNTAKTAAINF